MAKKAEELVDVVPEQKEQTTKKRTSKATGQEEPLFYIHELREHSRTIFNVRPEVIDAALKHERSNRISKKRAKALIDSFLGKKVNLKGVDKG